MAILWFIFWSFIILAIIGFIIESVPAMLGKILWPIIKFASFVVIIYVTVEVMK